MLLGVQPRLGLGGVVAATQGRPAWRSPTLGWGTQSRWDWGVRLGVGCDRDLGIEGHRQDARATLGRGKPGTALLGGATLIGLVNLLGTDPG
jgi:hypothetical protein